MNNLTVVIVILLTSNLPSSMCLPGEGLRGPPPCINKTRSTVPKIIIPRDRDSAANSLTQSSIAEHL